jgi:methionyl aminopeptidase
LNGIGPTGDVRYSREADPFTMTKKKRRRREARRGGASAILGIQEIGKMRAAGRLAAKLLDSLEGEIHPGVTTADIDRTVEERTVAAGAKSAPYGYHGFPAHVCTSINEVVCHGIPDLNRVLRDGDIINVDVTPILDGFHGDASRTFLVGSVSSIARRLVEDTYTSLWRGIAAVRPGNHVGDIGHAIQRFIEPRGYSIVRQFSGHGIGRVFHTAPAVMHVGKPGDGEALVPGMTFTIEPMINLGDWRCHVLEDGWTVVTVDGSLSAQFEHTVLVTENGVEVLTVGADEARRLDDVAKHIRLNSAEPASISGALPLQRVS